MKKQTCISVLIIALIVVLISTTPTRAQISWGAATKVGSDSDVQKKGTYFDAALLLSGANGGNPLTVNGVAFNIIASGTANAADPSARLHPESVLPTPLRPRPTIRFSRVRNIASTPPKP